MQTQLGWIGTGVMGKSMCKHLLKAGYKLKIYNRTKVKCDELIQMGAEFCQPKEIAESCLYVFLMVGYPIDVESMVLTKERIIDHLKPGSVLIDHTTSSPALAIKIFQECEKKKIYSIDAPVSGGDVGAREGKLAIMCGGCKEGFDKVYPIFEKYGTNIKFQGSAGKGQHVKMANQIAIASGILGVVEALIYSYKQGLDLNLLIQTIGTGAAASFSLNVYGPRIIQGNLAPGFYVKHFVKDMGIALDEARRANLCLPGLALVEQFYQSLQANGGSELGIQGLIKVLEQMNNLKIEIKQTN